MEPVVLFLRISVSSGVKRRERGQETRVRRALGMSGKRVVRFRTPRTCAP